MQAEMNLREAEENYRTLVEQANDPIVVVHDDLIVYRKSSVHHDAGGHHEKPEAQSLLTCSIRKTGRHGKRR